MLKKALAIMFLLLALISCDGKRKYAGGYRRYGHPNDILQLKKDGTFYKRETFIGQQTSHAGTWELRKDEIYLIWKEGRIPYRIVNGNLIDNTWTEWKKD